MTEFQGIPIDESVLSSHILGGTILIGLVFAVAIFGLVVFFTFGKSPTDNKRQQKQTDARIRNLQKKAANNPQAEKELALCLCKKQQEAREKRKKSALFSCILLCMLALTVFGFFAQFSPVLQDRQYKDYVVYNGGFELRNGVNKYAAWIILPDGTDLNYRRFVCDDGSYAGTIVYAPRSKLVLGIEWEDVS